MRVHRVGGAIVDDQGRRIGWFGWCRKGISQRISYDEQERILAAVESALNATAWADTTTKEPRK
jgi:hypothetical protein